MKEKAGERFGGDLLIEARLYCLILQKWLTSTFNAKIEEGAVRTWCYNANESISAETLIRI